MATDFQDGHHDFASQWPQAVKNIIGALNTYQLLWKWQHAVKNDDLVKFICV